MPYHRRQSSGVSHHAAVDAATASHKLLATTESRRVVTDIVGSSRLDEAVALTVMLPKVGTSLGAGIRVLTDIDSIRRCPTWGRWFECCCGSCTVRCSALADP